MSGYQPFLISGPHVALERDLEPWLLPNDAYPNLEDCYLWRGRNKKRKGFNLLARLRRKIGTTNGSGDLTVTLANTLLGQGLSQFTCLTSVYQDAGGSGGDPQTLLVSGIGTATLNRTTGVFALSASDKNADVYYFPGLPVMGLATLESSSINQEGLVGFDTRYSYLFNTNTSAFVDASTYKISNSPFIWHGTDYNLFWTVKYSSAMWASNTVTGIHGKAISGVTSAAAAVFTVSSGASFVIGDKIFVFEITGTGTSINGAAGTVTNVVGNNVTTNIDSTAFTYSSGGVLFNLTRFISGDGIKWFDQDASGWVNFNPPITASTYLQGTLMIFPYKGRLICLNTTEGTFSGVAAAFPQRARWSGPAGNTPFYAPPVPTSFGGGSSANAWRSDIVGNGGFRDAPTNEMIISAEFVKDVLIVYFERSTWQLVYTGIDYDPFQWLKINTELGAESTFSIVPFDRTAIGIADIGIHTCDTINVERLDQKIPDETFKIQNLNQGVQRVYGIRDYFNQLVYWAIPYIGYDQDTPSSLVYPNRLLVYNYVDESFSFFNDSFTCFGYYQPSKDLTWENAYNTWEESDDLWIDPEEIQGFPDVVGGNQQGFVEILMQEAFNDVSLFISNISFSGTIVTITCFNHNLIVGQFVKITSASGTSNIEGNIYKIVGVASDGNSFTFSTGSANAGSGTFTGSGTLTVVNNFNAVTKRFNPFIQEGTQVRLGYIDFYFDQTASGQVTINIFLNEDSTLPTNSLTVSTAAESTYSSSPDLLPYVQQKIFKRVYVENISQLFQIQVIMSDFQMTTENVAESDIVIHSMTLWFSKSGRMINA